MPKVLIPAVFGPPAPTISFWYGERYLGVAKGHPSNIEAARAKLLAEVQNSVSPKSLDREVSQLKRAGAQLRCGTVVQDLSFSR
jgi:hypothetical protein